jgi:hypothetical protein
LRSHVYLTMWKQHAKLNGEQELIERRLILWRVRALSEGGHSEAAHEADSTRIMTQGFLSILQWLLSDMKLTWTNSSTSLWKLGKVENQPAIDW